MTNLQEVKGINKYCGPAVLAAITGKTTDECATAISYYSGAREVKAVNMHHLLKALNKLGFQDTAIKPNGYTLFGVLSGLSVEGFYIIVVPKHVVAVEIKEGKIYFIDNHTKIPINAAASARLSQRVDLAYKITEKEKPRFINSMIQVQGSHNSIQIKRLNRYWNTADDTVENLGNIYFKSYSELNEINIKLAQLLEGEQKNETV